MPRRNVATRRRTVFFTAASLPPGRSNFDYNIYRFTIGANSIQRLTQLTGVVEEFSLSADGTRAVFLQHGAYSVLNLDTRQVTPVHLRLQ